MAQRHLLPLILPGFTDKHRPAKGIGIGNQQCTFCTVDLHVWVPGAPYIEAGCDRTDGATGKIAYTVEVGGRVNLDLTAMAWLACDDTLRGTDAGRTGHSAHGSHQCDERREVVGSHI